MALRYASPESRKSVVLGAAPDLDCVLNGDVPEKVFLRTGSEGVLQQAKRCFHIHKGGSKSKQTLWFVRLCLE